MKRISTILLNSILALCLLCSLYSCSKSVKPGILEEDYTLQVMINQMQNSTSPSTKITYGGLFGESSDFETGDYFGLIVLNSNSSEVFHYKVYCSGLDNSGNTVWSVFKEPEQESGPTSNYTLKEIIDKGESYYAYYPYNTLYETTPPSSIEEIEAIVSNFHNTLPSDQSDSYTRYDLLVSSNIQNVQFGGFEIEGKRIKITFSHTTARLRFFLPQGAEKYEYLFSGNDFTPFMSGTSDGLEEYNFLFAPGDKLDICVKYTLDNHLYKISNTTYKDIFPIITKAGHIYYLDKNAPLVPYSSAVDMGTSVMWSPINLGAEHDDTITSDNMCKLKGGIFMWGALYDTGEYGNNAYTKYNNKLAEGSRPSELPVNSDISGNPNYDAAKNIWGGEWRIPTKAEWQELYNACTYEYITEGPDSYITFTSKSTGNSLTFRLSGYYNSTTGTQDGLSGYYWSSTSQSEKIAKSISTSFVKAQKSVGLNTNADRYTGLPVRPVYSKPTTKLPSPADR